MPTTPPAGTEYRFTVVAPPCGFVNSNDHEGNRIATWARMKEWTTRAIYAMRAAGVPAGIGLDRVRIDATARFPDRRKRDRLNLADTIKAVVDATTPQKHGYSTDRRTGRRKATVKLGTGLLVEDNDDVVESTTLRVGPPLTATEARGAAGWLVMTITVLDGCTVNPDKARQITERSAAVAARALLLTPYRPPARKAST